MGIPMLEECAGVGVQEAGEPPYCVCGAISSMVVVPARHFALVLRAVHVRRDTEDRLMIGAATKAALSITWAVTDLMVGLEFKAFITECGLVGGWSFVRVVEGDIIFVGRALCSSHRGHASTANWGTGGRLRINVIKNTSGEPCMYEMVTGLE